MSPIPLASNFLRYLASRIESGENPDSVHLPSINDLSKELGVGVAAVREQLEVARALGLVEVRPHTGIRGLPYNFRPAVLQSLAYAVAIDQSYSLSFSDLRNHIETAYWYDAVSRLSDDDQDVLRQLVSLAWEKLNGQPIQIPHQEHRQLHLTIFCRLDNPFVQGLLEAYWELYEAEGLNLYADYNYLQQVWRYHQDMVESICQGDFKRGYQALVEHNRMLYQRPISDEEN